MCVGRILHLIVYIVFVFFPFVNLLCNRIIRFKSKQWSKHCPKRNTTAKHMDGNTILLFYFIDYILCEHTHTQPSPPPQSSSHTQTCGTMRFDVVLRMFCCSSISSFFSLISYCVFVCCKNISHCVCIISCIHFRPFVFVLRCATSGVCEREWCKKKIWYYFMCEIDTIRTNKAHQQFYFFSWSPAILIFPRCASLFTFLYCLLPTLTTRRTTMCTIISMYNLSLNQYKLFILPPHFELPFPLPLSIAHTHTCSWFDCIAIRWLCSSGSGHIVHTMRTNNKINKNVLS